MRRGLRCGMTVIEPMTASARLMLERSGDTMPKIVLDVLFGEIFVALAKSQVPVCTPLSRSLS